MNKIIIIIGPTSTGKTDLAIKLCREFGGEIVSADSRQVYRGMDIGTGKTKTWLTDLVDPDYQFNVAEWVREAREVIDGIYQRNKIPFIVGGTWLYIKNLIEPVETLTIKPDWELRKELAEATTEQLQIKLQEIDMEKWKKMNESDKQNPRRLIRAIEVGLSSYKDKELIYNQYESLIMGLETDFKDLKEKITRRVGERVIAGMIEEIKSLLSKGYNFSLPSFSACGYRVFEPYFLRHETLEFCVNRWILQEQQYAKRQIAFMKKEGKVVWFNTNDSGLINNTSNKIRNFLLK